MFCIPVPKSYLMFWILVLTPTWCSVFLFPSPAWCSVQYSCSKVLLNVLYSCSQVLPDVLHSCSQDLYLMFCITVHNSYLMFFVPVRNSFTWCSVFLFSVPTACTVFLFPTPTWCSVLLFPSPAWCLYSCSYLTCSQFLPDVLYSCSLRRNTAQIDHLVCQNLSCRWRQPRWTLLAKFLCGALSTAQQLLGIWLVLQEMMW